MVRVMCTLMVTLSNIANLWSGIPTQYLYTKKKSIFRSPGRTYDNDAFNVDPDGDVVNDYWPVRRSYGSSPGLNYDYDDDAYRVWKDGDVVTFWDISVSCGRHSPHFSDEYGAYIVISDGYVDLYSWSATYSYGNYTSPETIDDNDAYYIYTSGVVVLDDYTSNSYGRIQLSGYTLYYFLVDWFKWRG